MKKRPYRRTRVAVAFVLLLFLGLVVPAHAQHGDYLLGSFGGLMGAQQPPEGILYSNLWSYYWASNSGFLHTGPIKCGPLGRLCLGANLNANGSLDMFVDQNVFWLVTPFKVPFIDATYGALIDVPFAIADATGNASLEPVLTVAGFRSSHTLLGSPQDVGGGVTKGSIADIFLEPVDLGWHFKQLDAILSGSVIIPSGPYNSHATVNIGSGNAAGLLGAGGIFYPDAARTWSLSMYSHYEMYASQMGRPYTLGDEAMLEWSAGKTFDLPSEIFKRLTIGPVGYAQWQTTDNQIEIAPINAIESTTVHRLEEANLRIYSAGPAVQLLTKYGMFDLRYYDEFGADATPSGQQLMFSVTLAGNPWG